jgi:hypothetical protein
LVEPQFCHLSGRNSDIWHNFTVTMKQRYLSETRVLDPRPKGLEFHMPSPPTRPYVPNKEAWRRTEKGDIHSLGQAWEEAGWALSPSSAIFGVQTWAFALNRQRIREGDKGLHTYTVSTSHRCVPVAKCGLLVSISVLVLQGFWRSYRCHHLTGAIWFPWDGWLLLLQGAPSSLWGTVLIWRTVLQGSTVP